MSAALRWLRLSAGDAAITVAVAAWAVLEALTLGGEVPTGWRVVFATAVTGAMALRRRWPGAALTIALGAFLLDIVVDVLPIEAVTPFQLLPLATYAIAAFGAHRALAGIAALVAVPLPVVMFGPFAQDGPVTTRDIVSLVVVQSVAAGAGWAVRRRREEAERQAESLRAAGLGADALVREGVEEERARIARELRAIVARALSAMDARLRHLDTAGAGQLAAVAADLQVRASAVMTDLQRLLGVLPERQAGVALPVSADAAVAAARARGWAVRLEGDGGAADASAGAVLAAGRVVEEVLAGDPPPHHQPVVVRADRASDGVRVRVSSRGSLPGPLADPASRGSLRERVRLHGGRARLRRRARRWSVDAVLPGADALRPGWRELVLGDVVVIGAATLVVLDDARGAGGAGPLTTLLLEAAVFVVPLMLRRRAPLAAVLVIAGGILALELANVLPGYSRTPIIAALLGSGAAAMHIADTRVAFAAAAVATMSAVAVNLLQLPPDVPLTDTPIILFMFVMAWGFGRRVRHNLERVEDARAGEKRLATEQWRRLHQTVAEERRSVARDLHDVVAHGVSLVGVLAGAAGAQARRDPERARGSLRAARQAVVQARAELERLTSALGDDPSAAPSVSLADVRDLVDIARAGGQIVDIRLDVIDVRRVPARVATSAYRIVQEALTNARKHAPGAETTVHITDRGDALLVEVRNDPAPGTDADGTRRGIAGMRERARLLGGDLAAAPEPGGGFAVRARLPVG
ncbi:MAG: hypothetical protein JHC84_14630 [Solirubrobacteraceae bacterium]|nr:hypothetical protein [Solirubrobacteraceae bacterium]